MGESTNSQCSVECAIALIITRIIVGQFYLMSALVVCVHAANRRQSHRHREMAGNVCCALPEKEQRLHVCVVSLCIS